MTSEKAAYDTDVHPSRVHGTNYTTKGHSLLVGKDVQLCRLKSIQIAVLTVMSTLIMGYCLGYMMMKMSRNCICMHWS